MSGGHTQDLRRSQSGVPLGQPSWSRAQEVMEDRDDLQQRALGMS